MIKKALFTLFILNSLLAPAQEVWRDSTAIFDVATSKRDSLTTWKVQAYHAQLNSDLQTEVMTLLKILEVQVLHFRNPWRLDEYKEVARMESLLTKNPGHPAVKNAAPMFYYLLGNYYIDQSSAKNIPIDPNDDMMQLSIESFHKAMDLAEVIKDWEVYYLSKIFIETNLKGNSLEKRLEWLLNLESELKEKGLVKLLPRVYGALGFIYFNLKEYEKSIFFHKKYPSSYSTAYRLNQTFMLNMRTYYNLQLLDSALYNAKTSYYLAEAYDTNMKVWSHGTLGVIYHELDSFQRAKYHFTKHQKLFDEFLDKQLIWLQRKHEKAIASNDMSGELKARLDLVDFKGLALGNMELAYQDAIEIERYIDEHPRYKESPEAIELYKAMGFMLQYQNNFQESEKYLLKAMELARNKKSEIETGEYYLIPSYLISLYGRMGDREKILELYPKIEKELLAEENAPRELSVFYEELGNAFFDLKDHKLAQDYLNKSIHLDPENSNAHAHISQNFRVLGKLDSALTHGKTALSRAKLSGNVLAQFFAHEALGNIYKELGYYERAIYHITEFQRLNSNLLSGDSAYRVALITQGRENEKSALKAALNNQRLKSQRIILWLVAGGAILIALSLLYIFNRLQLIKRQNRLIAAEKKRAEQSEKYKEQFLANMSHEIRTPLHAIGGMINTLRRKKHPDSQNPYLDAMKISADNLLVLLNDVLDLSKIESGSLDIDQKAMHVVEIVRNVAQLFHQKAEEKGLTLNVEISENLPKFVLGDAGRLQQILVNLVGNALKFTDEGNVKIKVFVEDNHIQFEVADTGIGMEEDQLESVFESFKQGTNLIKGHHGGTGLGLAITKQLIELQNGRIWAESSIGKGSTFYFRLPLLPAAIDKDTSTTLSDNELKAIGEKNRGLRILIAEDNNFNVMVVQDDLEWFIPEVQLTIVPDGRQALEQFKNNSFDLILMDVQMPEMNGYQATRAIRKLEILQESKRPIPIIAMTASLLKEQISRCYEAGMDGYIPKPYKPEQLIITVDEILSGAHKKVINKVG